MDDIKREEPEKACKKIRKVRVGMVVVHMVLVINTVDTAPTRHVADVCESLWIRLDCVAFSGSAVSERPHCAV